VIAASDNPAAAKALLEWLSGDEAQSLFASLDLEYPANTELMAHPIVEAWGDFKPNPINVSKAGALQTEAVKLMERAGYR
jgi:iron(III) transport system substrate-binding protein